MCRAEGCSQHSPRFCPVPSASAASPASEEGCIGKLGLGPSDRLELTVVLGPLKSPKGWHADS